MIFWLIGGVVLVFGFVVFFGAPYVPSKKKDLARALGELYPLGSGDVLVDIGSGDGVVLRAAAKRGVRKAIGYELNPLLVLLSKWLSRNYTNIEVRAANLWQMKLPEDTTVVYLFAVSRDAAKLTQKFNKEANRLGRSFKLISYGCELPGKTPIKTVGAHHLYDFTPLHAVKA